MIKKRERLGLGQIKLYAARQSELRYKLILGKDANRKEYLCGDY
ncbi:hypothetical protein SAMN05720354_10617 [Nitrosospira sp. Nsp1]|nr:hypothetical protein SAMN05720354_10617 [Nitrosospira sp. Nsp1]